MINQELAKGAANEWNSAGNLNVTIADNLLRISAALARHASAAAFRKEGARIEDTKVPRS
jgi:hypothetical protein